MKKCACVGDYCEREKIFTYKAYGKNGRLYHDN